MALFHPGGHALTDLAVRHCGFCRGDRVLDIGCGLGHTLSYLRDTYGIDACGCDRDESMIRQALERDETLQIEPTDGFLLDYPSCSFDGALLECSFSLMPRHDELMHELFCVLKPGGRLAVSDVYHLDPDPVRFAAARREAAAALRRPQEGEGCETDVFPSPCMLDGMCVPDALAEALTDAGFRVTLFQDRTQDLRDFVAQVLMDHGSFDAFWQAELPDGSDPKRCCRMQYGKHTGYFLLTAEKVAV